MARRKSRRKIVYWEEIRYQAFKRQCFRHPVTGKPMIVMRTGKEVVFVVPETGEQYQVELKWVSKDWWADAYNALIDEYFG